MKLARPTLSFPFTRSSFAPSFLATCKPNPSLLRHFRPPPHVQATAPATAPLPQPTPSPFTPPLFLRPPKHVTALSDLQQWHRWARSLALSVGSSLSDSDNGPDSALLWRELDWLLQDVLHEDADPNLVRKDLSVADGGPERVPAVVNLRADVQELYSLWRQRIEERRPFQYVVGCEHWRDLVLCVKEGVLIPRPETEMVVDLVGNVVANDGGLREGLWADLGTGSGAIAIGIARVLGNGGRVIATDLSSVSLQVATFNVRRYDLQDKIEVRGGSWFEPLKDAEGKLAGVVSNPPYIPSGDISGLQAEVGRHEPRLALDGGVGGMDDLLHLCDGAASMLRPGGFFAFETNGEKHCKFLVDYMENELGGRFHNVNVVSDFSGIQRFITGFRHY